LIYRYLKYFAIGYLLLLGCGLHAQNTSQRLLLQPQVIGNRSVSNDEILALLPQNPNKKFLFVRFKLFFYNKGKIKHNKQLADKHFEKKIAAINNKFFAKTKNLNTEGVYFRKLKSNRNKKIEKYEKKVSEGNWLMTSLGEPPVYYNQSDAQKNTEKITKYLFNKGFFNARTSFAIDSSVAGEAKISYLITENQPYKIKNISWDIPDKQLETVYFSQKSESLLKTGDRFDQDALNTESIRTENLFRNQGYYLYSRNQTRYKVHYLPTSPDSGVHILAEIKSPENNPNKQYQIGEVSFIVDASGQQNLADRNMVVDTVKMNNIQYIFAGDRFSTKFLHKKIFIKTGQIYKQVDQFETQKALQNLDQFKFANPNIDTVGNKLKVNFYAIPLEKFQFTGEGGFNVFQGIPGPFINGTFKVRNIFGGVASLDNTLRLGYEGQPGFSNNNSGNRSFEVGFNTSVNIPLILLPGKFGKLDHYNPRTQLGLGFNYANRLEYTRLNFKLAANYSWQISQKKLFNFSLIDLNLINTPKLSYSFDSTLNQLKLVGNNLRESFGKSFVSGISGSYVYNDNFLGQNQKGRYLRLFAEFGGNFLNFTKNNEIALINKILGNNLNYFKYGRLMADYRRFIPISNSKHSILAYRFNTGLAISYNNNSKILPYEKYLFAGGSYSLRAWEPRRLGLISYTANNEQQINNRLEQPGNLLLESSVEYRFPIVKLYGQLNGAAFIDAGNVWTLNTQNATSSESDFRLKNLAKQLALGTGFGLRYDFTYFVIRLDAAAKVIDPRYNSNKFVLDDFFRKNKDSNLNLNWNVGIGYPF
jgi:outer membrane protein assembly factor BamA